MCNIFLITNFDPGNGGEIFLSKTFKIFQHFKYFIKRDLSCFKRKALVWQHMLYTSAYGLKFYWFLHVRRLQLLILLALCHTFLHSDVNYCRAIEEQNNSFIVNWKWYPWFQILKSQTISSPAERKPLSWLLECALCSLNVKNMKRELKSSVSLHPWRLDSLTSNLILGDQSATWKKCEKKPLFHNILLK